MDKHTGSFRANGDDGRDESKVEEDVRMVPEKIEGPIDETCKE